MNSTDITPDPIEYYYIVCSLSGAFALLAVAISTLILVSICRTKPRLHTVRHLLTCNTCVASVLYCLVQTNNYAFLIFLPQQTSDIGCRWRGYFAYVTISGVTYSFLIQAISRLFISLFSTKYRWLVTYKMHYILIAIHWFVCVVAPLPAVVTKDIYFLPNALCWVPMERPVHVTYTIVVYYIVPILSVCTIYIFIYYRVRQTLKHAETVARSVNREKRDLELLRNILLLLMIYLTGGVPTLLFLMSAARILYLISIVTISVAVAIEKLSTILLDRELRQSIRKLFSKTPHVAPMTNTHVIARNQGNLTAMQQLVVQSVSYKQHIPSKVARVRIFPIAQCDHLRTNE